MSTAVARALSKCSQPSCGIAWPMPCNPLKTEASQLCWATGPRVALLLQWEICQTEGWILSERSLSTDRSSVWMSLAGIELGKVAGPVGWRLSNKWKWVIQGEVHQKKLSLHYQGGCQNGLQEDCKWLFFRDRAGWLDNNLVIQVEQRWKYLKFWALHSVFTQSWSGDLVRQWGYDGGLKKVMLKDLNMVQKPIRGTRESFVIFSIPRRERLSL